MELILGARLANLRILPTSLGVTGSNPSQLNTQNLASKHLGRSFPVRGQLRVNPSNFICQMPRRFPQCGLAGYPVTHPSLGRNNSLFKKVTGWLFLSAQERGNSYLLPLLSPQCNPQYWPPSSFVHPSSWASSRDKHSRDYRTATLLW